MLRPLVILFLLFSNVVFAQTENDDDLSYYYDDGDLSLATQSIKLNILSAINGDLAFSYEKAFDKRRIFALELGAGVILPYHVWDFYTAIWDDVKGDIGNTFGYSFTLQPKIYFVKPWGHQTGGVYWSFLYRKRWYSEIQNFSDFAVLAGVQIFSDKNITVDISYGTGLRFSRNIEDSALIMPAGLKIGYYF